MFQIAEIFDQRFFQKLSIGDLEVSRTLQDVRNDVYRSPLVAPRTRADAEATERLTGDQLDWRCLSTVRGTEINGNSRYSTVRGAGTVLVTEINGNRCPGCLNFVSSLILFQKLPLRALDDIVNDGPPLPCRRAGSLFAHADAGGG